MHLVSIDFRIRTSLSDEDCDPTQVTIVLWLLSLEMDTVTRVQILDEAEFHIALIPLGKVWIQLSSLQLGLQNTPTTSLQRSKTPPKSVLTYDTKQSDGDVQVMLEIWEMQSTPLMPSLPGPQ